VEYTNGNQIAGFVYSIYDTHDHTRKFGYASNVERRLQQIQTGNPYACIEYRLVVDDVRKAEKALHTIFAAKRLQKYSSRRNSEWFALDNNDLILLKKIFKIEPTTDIEKTMLEGFGLR
jgi:hypothetical protein